LVQRQGLAAFQKMFDKIFNVFASTLFNHVVKLSCKTFSHFGFKDPATWINSFQRGSINSDQPFQVAILAPK
jgi:hypothetical protein